MTKQEFTAELQKRLCGLPKQDIEERVAFYSEMIDDRIEEGLSEEEAVAEIGSVDEIVSQILSETPITRIAKEKLKQKRQLSVWEIVLLALGSPIWLSLAVVALAVILVIYVVLWSVVVTLWAVFGALVGYAVGSVAVGIVYICQGIGFMGIPLLLAGIICAGLSVFMFFGSLGTTKGIIILTKKIALCIKKLFVKKEKI